MLIFPRRAAQIAPGIARRPLVFPRRAAYVKPVAARTPTTLKAGLISAIKADAALAAIVGGRVMPNFVAKSATRPCIVVRVVSDVRGRVLAGHTTERIARVLIEIQDSRDATVEALARRLDAFLQEFTTGGTLGGCHVRTCLQVNEVDTRDANADGTDTGIFRRLIDYRFAYTY